MGAKQPTIDLQVRKTSMPLFVLHCHDKPGALELRLGNRPAHLAYLRGLDAQLRLAGPLLDAGGSPIGSLLIVDVADLAAAQAIASGDPYVHAGLFQSVEIHAFRQVLPDA
jgi:uncharacterized protein